MELKGSKTEKNLQAAFAGESQARNKYTYYASVAKKQATNRSKLSLKKRLTTKKNTLKSGSNSSTAANCPTTSTH